MNTERWIWIGGWGVPVAWLENLARRVAPFARHTVVPPTPAAIDAINPEQFERVVGYSLGAFLLLKEAAKVPLPSLLLAPFFAFPAEAKLGGKVRQTQLRVLQRWLRRDPAEALGDFYKRSGLNLPPPATLPYEIDDLEWGLAQLAEERAPAGLPKNWSGVIGENDPLLDSDLLQTLETRLKVVPRAGHGPEALLRAALAS